MKNIHEQLKHLAEISVRSLLETGVTGPRTQLHVAENFAERSVVDGTCEVHTQLINSSLHRHTDRHTETHTHTHTKAEKQTDKHTKHNSANHCNKCTVYFVILKLSKKIKRRKNFHAKNTHKRFRIICLDDIRTTAICLCYKATQSNQRAMPVFCQAVDMQSVSASSTHRQSCRKSSREQRPSTRRSFPTCLVVWNSTH